MFKKLLILLFVCSSALAMESGNKENWWLLSQKDWQRVEETGRLLPFLDDEVMMLVPTDVSASSRAEAVVAPVKNQIKQNEDFVLICFVCAYCGVKRIRVRKKLSFTAEFCLQEHYWDEHGKLLFKESMKLLCWTTQQVQ